MWPYQFAVSSEQTAQRREFLDTYARLAQSSILIPILILYLANIFRRFTQHHSQKVVQSQAVLWTRQGRKVAWWLDEKVGEEWNTRGEFLLVGSWGLWLGVCILAGIGNGSSFFSNSSALAGLTSINRLSSPNEAFRHRYRLAATVPLSPISKVPVESHSKSYWLVTGRTESIPSTFRATSHRYLHLACCLLPQFLYSSLAPHKADSRR